jgi:hypothetical protein
MPCHQWQQRVLSQAEGADHQDRDEDDAQLSMFSDVLDARSELALRTDNQGGRV